MKKRNPDPYSIKGIMTFIMIICISPKAQEWIKDLDEFSKAVKLFKDHQCPSLKAEAKNCSLVLAQVIAGGHKVSACTNVNVRISQLKELGTTMWEREVDPRPYQRLMNPIYEKSPVDFEGQPIVTPQLDNLKPSEKYTHEFYCSCLSESKWVNKVNKLDSIIYEWVSDDVKFDDLVYITKILSITLYSVNLNVLSKSLKLVLQLLTKFESKFRPFLYQIADPLIKSISYNKLHLEKLINKIFSLLSDRCLKE